MGLVAGGRGGAEEKEEEEKKKEKIPHMCESIGHRPLWGRCPALSPLLHLITPSRASGTADHVRSLDD